MNWLTSLYAEQTTPDEVVIFLLLGTSLTLLVAFVIYAFVLIVLSRWRMKKPYTLWSLLFPSAKRIRKYAAEYAMGTLTALLLALTVSAKHIAVESVLAQDISSIGHEKVRDALPFGGLTQQELVDAGADSIAAEKLATWLSDGIAKPAATSIESLIRPLLVAGMADNANIIVRAVVEELGPVSNSIILQRVLLVAAVLLLLGYVLWFGIQRWREMQQERANEPGYATIIKRLSLPAVCIPLLFVSAVALEDTGRIVNSAMAAAGATEPVAEIPLGRVIEEQAAVVSGRGRSLDARDLEELNANLRELTSGMANAGQRLAALDTRLNAVEAQWKSATRRLDKQDELVSAATGDLDDIKNGLGRMGEKIGTALENLETQVRNAERNSALAVRNAEQLKERTSRLEQELRRLAQLMSQTDSVYGLLLIDNLVVNTTYVVRERSANGPIVGRGNRVSIHALDPGRYVIMGNRLRTVTTVVAADKANTVQLFVDAVIN